MNTVNGLVPPIFEIQDPTTEKHPMNKNRLICPLLSDVRTHAIDLAVSDGTVLKT